MGLLIDTSVLVAWERDGAAAMPEDDTVAMSVVTVSELLHGVHRARSAQRRHQRSQWVEKLVAAIPVLPVDEDVARTHARIWADLAATGQLIGAHDLFIAATALAHDLTLATRDEGDFGRVEGLRLLRL